eukprot:6180392-Pleurochrysis_carterae.AAC.1
MTQEAGFHRHVYKTSRPEFVGKIDLYLENGSMLYPDFTDPELSRPLAELSDNDGGISHKQRSTVKRVLRRPGVMAKFHPALEASMICRV